MDDLLQITIHSKSFRSDKTLSKFKKIAPEDMKNQLNIVNRYKDFYPDVTVKYVRYRDGGSEYQYVEIRNQVYSMIFNKYSKFTENEIQSLCFHFKMKESHIKEIIGALQTVIKVYEE